MRDEQKGQRLNRLQINNPEVSKYPALFASTLTDLIVVGAVYTDGTATEFSQGGPLVTVCAPAAVKAGTRIIGIACADSRGTGKAYKVGTSFAAPQVAGLAAYFMSTVPSLLVPGKVAQNVKNYIVSKAYSRKRGPLAIFNDFDFRTGRTCAVAARRSRNKRNEISTLDACLQSYPSMTSTYQAEESQRVREAGGKNGTLNFPGTLPDATRALKPSVSTTIPSAISTNTKKILSSTKKESTPTPTTNLYSASADPSTKTSATILTSIPLTTVMVLETDYLPPPPRGTVTSVVWLTPSSPSSTTAVHATIETPLFLPCIEGLTNTLEAECWKKCQGGKCGLFINPFGNSQPWWTCERCPT